jgi:hypothetical protein
VRRAAAGWIWTILLAVATASADERRPIIELAAGGAVPIGGSDEWTKRFDASLLLIARGGVSFAHAQRRLGLDVEVAFSPLHTEPKPMAFGNQDRWSFDRLRFGPAVRAGLERGPAFLYAQVALDVDWIFGSFTNGTSGVVCDTHSFGWAIAPAVGLRDPAQHIGVELALPIAHHGRTDPCFDANYTGIDLDVLATLNF